MNREKREIATHVWYPTFAKASVKIKNDGPFLPVLAPINALIAPSQFPGVLLSHGSGGKADELFWLTDFLVRHGIIVVETDHVGNMTGVQLTARCEFRNDKRSYFCGRSSAPTGSF